MPAIRDHLRAHGSQPTSSTWLMLFRSTAEPVGIGGFSEDQHSAVFTGYSVYPVMQGRGLATEAMTALLARVFEQSHARLIRATIPPTNTACIRVAEKLGMQRAGAGHDPEAGPVLIYERLQG